MHAFGGKAQQDIAAAATQASSFQLLMRFSTESVHDPLISTNDNNYQEINSFIPKFTVTVMPNAIFVEPKLAEIYDLLDSPDRPDLVPYLAIAEEFHAHSVIDLGCGTGTLACRFASRGFEVVGIDPAAASLNVARRKASAPLVRWIPGTAALLKGLHANCSGKMRKGKAFVAFLILDFSFSLQFTRFR